MIKRDNRTGVFKRVLEYVMLNPNKKYTNILIGANINAKLMKEYFYPLIERGAIKKDLQKRYLITKKGITIYEELLRIIIREEITMERLKNERRE